MIFYLKIAYGISARKKLAFFSRRTFVKATAGGENLVKKMKVFSGRNFANLF
jgi:hypothetical protein